ncbi:PAS domain-containing protein [Synechocystis sp. LKSZ1]|uniref:PAS domain-containing protein n=1 Tax=Synechocystis sp. LKSZ1 TaxID=3144951 RepID=UPI00336C0056
MGDSYPTKAQLLEEITALRAELANLKNQQAQERAVLSGQGLKNDQQFLYLADQAPVLIWMAGLDKGCFYFNQPWLTFTGRSLEQEQGNGWAEGVHPDDLERCWQTYSQAFDARQAFRIEYRLKNAQGDYRWLLDHGIPNFDLAGEFLGYIGSCVDITDRYQAKLAIESSEAKYQELVELVNSIIIRWDETGKILFINRYGQQFFGYSEAEIIGKNLLDTIVPQVSEDGEDLSNLTTIVYEHPETFKFHENENICKNGQRVWIAWTNQCLILPGGRGREMLSVGTDMSHRKQMEQALRQREEELKEAQHIAKLGHWKFEVASEKVVWSEEVYGIFGLDPQQPPPTYPEIASMIHELDREKHSAVVQQLLETGQGPDEEEYRAYRADGSLSWMWVKYQPTLDEAGRVVSLSGVAMDITERKTMELELAQLNQALEQRVLERTQALQQSEERLRLAFEVANMGHWDWNILTNEILWSESLERIMGLEPGGFKGDLETVMAMIYPDDRLLVQSALKRSLEEEAPYDLEFRFIKPNGSLRWAASRATVIRDDQGQPIRVIGVDVDITRRKKTEEALYRANQKLKENLEELQERNDEMILLAGISDYLQSCLTVQEACNTIATLASPLFPDCAGGIFLLDTSHSYLAVVASWGLALCSEDIFKPIDCWALRRGQAHWIDHDHHGLCCHHLNQKHLPEESLCLPLVAQGEIIGLFYLCSVVVGSLNENRRQLARTLAEQIGSAVANITLRERLQQQSIRDPLTNLFNRRYLQEMLAKEIARAQRHHYPVGIILLDLDHFKQFNDTLGHEAGDIVLVAVGQLLKEIIRESDTACRYGGEELLLVLPETSPTEAAQKAEDIRLAIAQLRLSYHGQTLPPLTVSLGVASIPQHGLQADAVIQSADLALYQAKAEGRNRVVLAPT